ncbi:transglutaminase-like cysteine peptidase [Oceaniserpentilla sp. 4NH20-0058]|uniref:transglutaminase-like cysteine peptidase n=1 Tax=Oceaniserpentilla sp. 4NH20-0058 TaxID=3127660 RepID=UPI00310372DE
MLNKARIQPNIAAICMSVCFACWVLAQNTHALLNEASLAQVTQGFGEKGRQVFVDWTEFVIRQASDTQKGSEQAKLETINRYFNERLKFVSDETHWQKEDYWATPIESLASAAGDCEDYVIAKYFSLIQSGIPQEKLRITYVKAMKINQAHMVLAYYKAPKSEPLILDNLNPRILRASKRRDLVPVYSFNGMGLWLEQKRGQSIKVGTASRLSMWMDVLFRMQAQGLEPWMQLPSGESN